MASDPNYKFRRRQGATERTYYEQLRNPTSLGITILGWRWGWKVKRLYLEMRIDHLIGVEKKLRARIAELTGEPEETLSHLTIKPAKSCHVPGTGWGEKRQGPTVEDGDSSTIEEVVVPSSP